MRPSLPHHLKLSIVVSIGGFQDKTPGSNVHHSADNFKDSISAKERVIRAV